MATLSAILQPSKAKGNVRSENCLHAKKRELHNVRGSGDGVLHST